MIEIGIGLLIIAIGSFGQSSSYVPINKIRDWSWESFWLVQGIFAWLVFPYLGAMLAVPEGSTLLELWCSPGSLGAVIYGMLWGVGGLTFGLSMRYLGVALGQSIALGTCAGFGTLFPALFGGTNLFEGTGLILLTGVCITLAGIAVIGYAGSLRARNMSEEEKKAAVKDFALTKGLAVALLAGVMSACFNLGLESGNEVLAKAKEAGASDLFALNPVILLVTLGGFCTNAVYCIFQNVKNGTGKDYFSVSGGTLLNNVLFCALAGVLWYSQFFGLGMGKSYFSDSPVMLAFSWSILMSLNVIFSNVWGILLKEWKGVDRRTICGIDYRHVYLDPFLIISEYSLIKIDMIILRNNERLMAEIDRIAEVAGYLWTKGWAERNGGNISVNLTTLLSEEEKALPALVSSIPLQEAMTALCGHVFYVTGTGKRMRYVAKDPFANGSLIRIAADGKSYDILAEQPIPPTSELPSHLLMHNFLRAKGRDNRVVLHTHPTDIIGMTHCKPFLDSEKITRTLWSMIPECRIIVPKGVGIVPYEIPGTLALAHATIRQLEEHDVVFWEKHGILAVGEDLIECFDAIDTLSKSAQIYFSARMTGYEPEGMTEQQLDDLVPAFGL